MADDKIRLGLDLGDSAQQAAALAAALNGVKVAAAGVGDAYEIVGDEARESDVAFAAFRQEMGLDVAAVNKLVGTYGLLSEELADARRNAIALDDVSKAAVGTYEIVTDSNRTYAREVETTGKSVGRAVTASDRLAKSNRDLGRATLETGRIVQDFAQGGVAGILNNAEGLVMALGGGAGLAGLLTGVGVAAYVAYPPLRDFIKGIVDGANDIPKSTDALTRLNDELKTSKERLAELKDKQSLTNDELAEYNGLLPETVRLEKEANAERDRRNGLEKARKEQEAGGLDPEGAKAAKAAMDAMGGVDDAVNATRNAMLAEDPKVRAAREAADRAERDNAAAAQNPLNPLGQLNALAAIRKARQERDAATKGVETGAQDLVLKARQGDQGAIGELARLIPGGGFAAATTEGLASKREIAENAERERERVKREAKSKEDAAKAAADAEKGRTAELNAAGAEGERQYRDQVADNAKADKAREDGVREQQRNMTDAQKAVQAANDARDRRDLRGVAANQFGFGLSDEQAAEALKGARGLMGQGIGQRDAGRAAVGEVVERAVRMLEQQSQIAATEADRIQALQRRLDMIGRQQQAVPEILDWGMGQ